MIKDIARDIGIVRTDLQAAHSMVMEQFGSEATEKTKENYPPYVAFKRIIAKIELYEQALNEIASWSEGDFVDGSFDCPGDARTARAALVSHVKGEA